MVKRGSAKKKKDTRGSENRNVLQVEVINKNDQEIQKHKPFLRKRIFKLVIFVLILLLGCSVFALLIQQGIIQNPFKYYGKVERKFIVKDECSLIVGKLIHTINDEGFCESRCKMHCNVREMSYARFEFRKAENDCNICDCYCK